MVFTEFDSFTDFDSQSKMLLGFTDLLPSSIEINQIWRGVNGFTRFDVNATI